MKRTAFFHDEKCLWHTAGPHALIVPAGGWVQPPANGGHAESPESKRRLKALMDVSGLSERLAVQGAPMATEEDLLRVHSVEYLRRFRELSDAGGGECGVFAPFGKGSYEIAKLSAGLAKHAMNAVLKGEYLNAYALSRPPGHHCLPGQGMGFCLLANIAIAIEAAKAMHGVERILVLDWDVHHGNGTQHIFYQRSDVYTISIHQEACFPPGYSGFDDRGEGEGQGYNLNVPLLPGGGHDAYMYAMERIVIPAIQGYRPDLIVVASGYDANDFDPLGRMMLHSESYRELMRSVMLLADTFCQGRVVVVHEGGYAEAVVPFCGHALVEALADEKMEVTDPFLDFAMAQQPFEHFRKFQRQVIDEMAARLK